MIVQHHWQGCCVFRDVIECEAFPFDRISVAVEAILVWLFNIIETHRNAFFSSESTVHFQHRQSWQPSVHISYKLDISEPLVAESKHGG